MVAECQVNACGVLAVGRCRSCGSAFCASHAGYGYVDLCQICLDDQNEQIWAPERERKANEAARAASLADRLLAIADPHERLVVTVRTLSTIGSGGNCFEDPAYKGTFSKVLPELTNPLGVGRRSYTAREPNWDSAAIAKWFSLRAGEKSVKTDDLYRFPRMSRRGKVKYEKPQPVWVFSQGAFVPTRSRVWDAHISRSGEIALFVTHEFRRPVDTLALRPKALYRMADLLGLPLLT